MTVARTVCHWSTADKTALVQVGNPSHHVYTRNDTLMGQTVPVSVALNKRQVKFRLTEKQRDLHAVNFVLRLLKRLIKPRSHLANAHTYWSYDKNTAAYFPYTPSQELSRRALADAEFLLEPDTRPVHRTPYRANPSAQENIDKCMDQTEQERIVEQRPNPWGFAATIVAKTDGTPIGSAQITARRQTKI